MAKLDGLIEWGGRYKLTIIQGNGHTGIFTYLTLHDNEDNREEYRKNEKLSIMLCDENNKAELFYEFLEYFLEFGEMYEIIVETEAVHYQGKEHED